LIGQLEKAGKLAPKFACTITTDLEWQVCLFFFAASWAKVKISKKNTTKRRTKLPEKLTEKGK